MKNKRYILGILPLLLLAGCQGGETSSSTASDSTSVSSSRKVYPDEVVELTVWNEPEKLTYKEGETFSPNGLEMTATLGDGSTEDVYIGDCEIYPSGELMPTDTEVEIVYFEGSVTFPITVTANPCTSLVMETNPVVESYIPGQKINLDGLNLVATFEDGTVKDSVSSYSLTLDGEEWELKNPLTADVGTHTLTFSYHSASVDFPIEIFEGSIIEAENIIESKAVTFDDRNYLEKMSSSYSFRKLSNPSSEPASGKAYVGYIRQGDVLRFHIFAEESGEARLYLRAASASTKRTDGSGTPIEMNSILVSDVCSIDINGTAFTLTDQSMPGALSRYADKSVGDSLLWVKWQNADLGVVDLVKGDNTITIDTSEARSFKDFNLDRIELRPAE